MEQVGAGLAEERTALREKEGEEFGPREEEGEETGPREEEGEGIALRGVGRNSLRFP